MASPVRAYSLLSNLQGTNRLKSASSGYALSKDMAEEARREEEKRRKREGKRALGRLFGSGAGLLASILLAPVTGGLSTALQAAIAGGTAFGTSQLGQRAFGGARRIGPGKFNIAEDRDTERFARDSILSSSIKDAISAGLFQASGGVGQFKKPPVPGMDKNVIDAMSKLKMTAPSRMPLQGGTPVPSSLLDLFNGGYYG